MNLFGCRRRQTPYTLFARENDEVFATFFFNFLIFPCFGLFLPPGDHKQKHKHTHARREREQAREKESDVNKRVRFRGLDLKKASAMR